MSPNQDHHVPYVLKSQGAHAEGPERSFRVTFILVISFGGLLGLIGNGLLLCFYGNRYTRTYRSRDAIYIRRMAYADLLICTVVIPYAVIFEAGLIKDDMTCKTMEFIRHFLVYLSHLLLYTYAWELPQRHLYSASKTFNVNTMIYSVLMSFLGAAPTVFIFRVESFDHYRYHKEFRREKDWHMPVITAPINKSHSMSLASGPSCHLITEFMPHRESYDVKSLTWVYVTIPVVVFSMSLYWVLINLAAYLNTVKPNQKDSLFLTDLEDICLFQPVARVLSRESLQRIGGSKVWKKSKSREGKSAPCVLLGYNRKGSAYPTQVLAIDDDDEEDDTADSSNVADKEEENNNRSMSPVITTPSTEVAPDVGATDTTLPRPILRQTLNTASTNNGLTNDVDTHKVKIVGFRKHNRKASKEQEEATSSRNGDSKPQRPILKEPVQGEGGTFYPRVGSYKKSLATLILGDLIMVPVVMAAFLVTGGNSVVLNMVHLKSIVSFYALAVLSPYLRQCVLGDDMCPCFPEANESQGGEPDVLTNLRQSVLQISLVKERLRERQIQRKLRKQQRLTLAQTRYGTVIY